MTTWPLLLVMILILINCIWKRLFHSIRFMTAQLPHQLMWTQDFNIFAPFLHRLTSFEIWFNSKFSDTHRVQRMIIMGLYVVILTGCIIVLTETYSTNRCLWHLCGLSAHISSLLCVCWSGEVGLKRDYHQFNLVITGQHDCGDPNHPNRSVSIDEASLYLLVHPHNNTFNRKRQQFHLLSHS